MLILQIEEEENMQCYGCGNEMGEDALFCSRCGLKLGDEPVYRRMRVRCNSCGEVFEVEQTLSADLAALEVFKSSALSIITPIAAIVSLIITWVMITYGNIPGAFLAGVQTILFAFAWLTGMQMVKTKNRSMYTPLTIAGFVFAVLLLISCGGFVGQRMGTIKWQDVGLCATIPEPRTKKGTISIAPDNLYVDLYKVGSQEYDEYVNECIKKGFNIEVETGYSSFYAYREDGCRINVYYDDEERNMSIFAYAPIEMGDLDWSEGILGYMLPVPESSYGKIISNSDSCFSVYVGNTTKVEVDAYVRKCIDYGFVDDYGNSSAPFYANDQGYALSVRYEGLNTMYIDIYKY